MKEKTNSRMNIVIAGHVDHGKSTLIGRLLFDTGSLPEGKLEQVWKRCERNARPFEYAFLLDALKDEQAQGITIDTARCFFKSKKRHYIIIDAPGHIEFLKNMVTGAARAEAALLVIDAAEGVQDNSRRHGFMLSLLGLKQVVVLINKMDLVDYQQEVFERVKNEYVAFLEEINIHPAAVLPISARHGDNLVTVSPRTPWYNGLSVLDLMDCFEKEEKKEKQPFRFPVQDIYKFTEGGDDRRIIAGTVETGTIDVGDEVVFLPSQKRSIIKSIESFNEPPQKEVPAGYATGFTLNTQLYLKPGEIMCKASEALTKVGATFRANIFWLGKNPMLKNKRYKIKLATNRTSLYLQKIIQVVDASDLTTESGKQQIDRHDVAECVLQTLKPMAYDLSSEIEATGRFVIIDGYEIAGGGIILDSLEDEPSYINQHVRHREYIWEKGSIKPMDRAIQYHQKPKFVVITGKDVAQQQNIARALEENLFKSGRHVYYLGLSNILCGLDSDVRNEWEDREEHVRRIGELARIFTDACCIFITTIPDLESFEAEILRKLNEPNEILVVNVGGAALGGDSIRMNIDTRGATDSAVRKIKEMLYEEEVLLDYYL